MNPLRRRKAPVSISLYGNPCPSVRLSSSGIPLLRRHESALRQKSLVRVRSPVLQLCTLKPKASSIPRKSSAISDYCRQDYTLAIMKSRNRESEISDTWQGLVSTTACFHILHKKHQDIAMEV